jgi:Ca2+-binding EF-hand superfamily protein
MRNTWAGIVAAVVFVNGPLRAQEGDDLFTKLDANRDGYVSLDEVPEGQRGLFERLLRIAGKEDEQKLNKVLFQAALRSDEGPKQPLGGAGPPGRPGVRGGQFDGRQLFSRFDANSDGKLSRDELPPQMQEQFARLDANGDGALSEEEFSRGGRGLGQRSGGAANPPSPRELEALFDRTDANSDGKLTKDEVPEERVGMRRIFEQAGSEAVTKEQFLRFMAQSGGQPPGARGGRPDGAPRPEGAPQRRPDDAPPGAPPPGGPPGGLFALLDTDRDGQLSTSEIVAAGTALLKLDRNGDGKLTPDEVFAGPPGSPPPRPDDARPPEGRPGEVRPGGRGNFPALRDRLRQADANGDGKLSKDEVPDFLRERFDRLDSNGDGVLDDAELQRLGPPMREGGDRPGTRRPAAAPDAK